MNGKTLEDARSLFIVSKDYGELGMVVSFLRDQKLADRAAVLLPENLYSLNKNVRPGSTYEYKTLENIQTVLNNHNPDLVFLFSGYLLSNDKLLSPKSVERLVQLLRARGCRVITSDPLVGLASRITASDIDVEMFLWGIPFLQRCILRLVFLRKNKSIASVRSLDDVVHLYATSSPESNPEDRMKRFSYFNPKIVRATIDLFTTPAGDSPKSGMLLRQMKWLFVLSSTDLRIQQGIFGVHEFERLLIRMLKRTSSIGKYPTLIAPATIIKSLSRALSNTVELISLRPFSEFESRILGAEYVFYWNAFSFSMLPRLANTLPVFFFDRGHLARVVKPYYRAALTCHFSGSEPNYLDQRDELDPGALAKFAEKQKSWARSIVKHWQSSPTPDQLVSQLLNCG